MSRHKEQKFFFVVNPRSGNYREKVVRKRLADFLSAEGVSGEVHYFVDEETLRQSVGRAIAEGFRSFIVVGGDGMVALVAGHLKGKRLRMGIVPTGTANMLAQLLGIPVDNRKALEVLTSSTRTKTIDGLAISGRLFFMNASIGLSSYSIQELRTEEKSLLKSAAYVLAVLRSMRKAVTRTFYLEIDGKPRQVEAAELFVDNAGALVTPRYRLSDARLDDGKAEVCLVHKGTPAEFLSAMLDIFVRKNKRAIHWIGSAGQVRVDCEQPLPVQADGDAVTETPVTIEVVPAAATFIVP